MLILPRHSISHTLSSSPRATSPVSPSCFLPWPSRPHTQNTAHSTHVGSFCCCCSCVWMRVCACPLLRCSCAIVASRFVFSSSPLLRPLSCALPAAARRSLRFALLRCSLIARASASASAAASAAVCLSAARTYHLSSPPLLFLSHPLPTSVTLLLHLVPARPRSSLACLSLFPITSHLHPISYPPFLYLFLPTHHSAPERLATSSRLQQKRPQYHLLRATPLSLAFLTLTTFHDLIKQVSRPYDLVPASQSADHQPPTSRFLNHDGRLSRAHNACVEHHQH